MKRFDSFKPRLRRDGLLSRPFGGELLIYDLQNHKAFCLNGTAATIWHLCDGRRSVADLAHQLERHYESEIDERIIWLALTHFAKHELLQRPSGRQETQTFSRRKLIRAGFAAAVALPLITVITAPIAVQAASAITAAVCATRHPNDLPGQGGCLGTPCVSPGGTTCRRVGSASDPCGCA